MDAVVLAALLVGCHEGGESGPCDGVDCSGHGACFVRDSAPQCNCEPGYHPEALECLLDEADGDGDADADSEEDADGPEDADVSGDADSPTDADADGASDPILAWTWTVGSGDDDGVTTEEAAHSIAVGGDGTAYVGGRFVGTVQFDAEGDITISASAAADAYLAALSADGAVSWVAAFGGPAGDGIHDVCLGPSAVYAVGWFSNTVDMNPAPGGAAADERTSQGRADAFVSAFDLYGGHLWTQDLGSTGADQAVGCAVLSDGAVAVVGFHSASLRIPNRPGNYAAPHSLEVAGPRDGFLAIFEMDGDYRWAFSLGGDGTDTATAVDAAEGNIVVGGFFESVVDFDPLGPTTQDVASDDAEDGYILSIDEAGTFGWVAPLHGEHRQEIQDLCVTATGSVISTGMHWGMTDFDPSPDGVDERASLGSADVFILRLDSAGRATWLRTFGSGATERARGLACRGPAGAVSASGSFAGSVDFDDTDGNDTRAVVAAGDAYVVSYREADGFYFGTFTLGGPDVERANAVSWGPGGTLWMAGEYSGTLDFGVGGAPDLRAAAGSSDSFASPFAIPPGEATGP